MRNWTPGVKPKRTMAGMYDKYSALMRLVISICVTVGLKPADIVKNMTHKNGSKFAQELHDEMAEHSRKDMETAMNALTRKRS